MLFLQRRPNRDRLSRIATNELMRLGRTSSQSILTKRCGTSVPHTSEENLKARLFSLGGYYIQLGQEPTHEDAPNFIVERYQPETSDNHKSDPA